MHALWLFVAIRAESTQSMINPSWAPQEEDFRDMPIFPTTEEILGIKSGELNPRLRASILLSICFFQNRRSKLLAEINLTIYRRCRWEVRQCHALRRYTFQTPAWGLSSTSPWGYSSVSFFIPPFPPSIMQSNLILIEIPQCSWHARRASLHQRTHTWHHVRTHGPHLSRVVRHWPTCHVVKIETADLWKSPVSLAGQVRHAPMGYCIAAWRCTPGS